eukprot:827141-Prymnesium_polylepis.1
MARTAHMLLALLATLRDGASFGGADAFTAAVTAAAAAVGGADSAAAEDAEDRASISTLVRGPQRWFELRSAEADLAPLDVAWMAEQVRGVYLIRNASCA